jgi:hypothetical protein
VSSHPTNKARNRRKKVQARYAKAREDAQLAGLIPTTPEGAVRGERVDPRLQSCQQLPQLIRQALREGWNVPDSAKPGIIAELLQPFYAQDGPQDYKLLIRLARLLLLLDQTQDHSEEAGKAKGGGSATMASVQANIQAAALIREMIESGSLPGSMIPPSHDNGRSDRPDNRKAGRLQ